MTRRTRHLVSIALTAGLAAGLVGDARADASHEAGSSFERFATDWMDELAAEAEGRLNRQRLLRLAGNTTGKGIQYKTVSKGYSTRLKETGKSVAPYVGILTYTEDLYQCSDAVAMHCRLVESSPITEIFPYTDGRWQY